MRFMPIKLPGAWLIDLEPATDERPKVGDP